MVKEIQTNLQDKLYSENNTFSFQDIKEDLNIKVSIMPGNISIFSFAENTLLSSIEISQLNSTEKSNLWYFNRIFVPARVRNRKIATQLMNKLVEILDEKKIDLACDINPYGDLNFEQLKRFYSKFGFVEHDVFHLIRKAR